MILDIKENVILYKGINTNLDKAIDFMLSTDLDALPVGKYLIDEDEVFVLIQSYETKDIQDALFEAHHKYADIQLILMGNEWIGYAPVSNLTTINPYDEQRDIEFLSGDGEFNKLQQGMFSIYFPTDAHKPSVNEVKTLVRKAVFKVKI